jgi:hypothetical protein
MSEMTTIQLKKTTRDKLKGLGSKGESWDSLLNRLMDERKETENK